jgi:allantoin racemase
VSARPISIANVLSPGLVGFGPPPGLLNEKTFVEEIEMEFWLHPASAVEMLLADLAALDAATRAGDSGFDAVFINSTSDYGLRPARAALTIPVIGAGQAAMALASQLGHRFGLISIWPESTRELHEVQLREYQLTDRCGAMRFVTAEEELETLDGDVNFYTQTRNGEAVIVERVLGEIERAVNIDGCDVVVLGCTCMHPIADELAMRSEVPVVNPLAAGFAVAESMARLNMSQSPAAHRSPQAGREGVIRAAVLAATEELADTQGSESCGAYCAISQGLARQRALDLSEDDPE